MAGLTKEERLKREAEKQAQLQAEAEQKAEAKFKEENDLLKQQIEQMQAMLQQLMNQQQATTEAKKDEEPVKEVEEIEEIPLTKRISVTSIATGGINLKTSYDGSARKYRLEGIGQSKSIPYEYLIDCINTDRWLFEEGYVYINNPAVVEDQMLEEYYQKFLTPEKIQNILSFDVDTIREMVSNTAPAIQETICELVIDKIKKGENVDLNKVYAIGKSCTPQVNILDIAQN